MKILLLNLPLHTPTVMPYSLSMLYSVVRGSVSDDVKAIDFNSKYHRSRFSGFYERIGKEDFLKLFDEFMAETRHVYTKASKAIHSGENIDYLDEVMQEIEKYKPDVVAISCVYNSQIFFTKQVIDSLNKKGIDVVIGGPADYSIISKEITVINDYSKFVDYLVERGCKREEKKIVQDFSMFDKKDYFTEDLIYPMRTADSCPYKLCTFCTHHLNRKYNMYDLSYIKEVIVKNDIKKICFIDDCFTMSRLKEIAAILRPLNVTYWMQLRPTKDMINVLEEVYDSGLRAVCWGIESANQRVLDMMVKGTKVEDVKEVLHKSKKLGIINQVYVMFGLPTESKDEFMETVQFLEDNSDDIDLVSTSVFGLQKDSIIWKEPKKHGVLDVVTQKRTYLGDKISYMPESGLTQEEAMNLKKKVMHRIHKVDKYPHTLNSSREQVLNVLY